MVTAEVGESAFNKVGSMTGARVHTGRLRDMVHHHLKPDSEREREEDTKEEEE